MTNIRISNVSSEATMKESKSPLKAGNIILVATWILLAYFTSSYTYPKTKIIADKASRIEEATGISFAKKAKFHIGGLTNMSLAGVGVRKLAIIPLYSLGLYVAPSTAKALEKESNKCKYILQSTAPKVAQLTFAMGIGPEKIAEALSAVNADEAVKKKFHDMILDGMKGGKMKSKEKMSLEWKGSDVISVSIRGKHIGQMKDKALANGVIELYLGPKSVSPSLRRDLGCV